MRPSLALAAALAFAGCHRPTPAVTPPPLAPEHAAVEPAPPNLPAIAPAPDGGTPGPALTSAQLAAIESYAAFSKDGLAFAAAEMSLGAGVPVLTFYASPTGTVEKRVVLDSPVSKQSAALDLAADGFPPPGAKAHLPPGMSAKTSDHSILITMVGRPVTKPVPAFPEEPGLAPSSATLVAVSNDGHYAAVRVVADGKVGEFGPAKTFRLVRLFQ